MPVWHSLAQGGKKPRLTLYARPPLRVLGQVSVRHKMLLKQALSPAFYALSADGQILRSTHIGQRGLRATHTARP